MLASRTSARKLRIHGVTPSPGPCVSTVGTLLPSRYPGCTTHLFGEPLTVADQRRILTGFPFRAVTAAPQRRDSTVTRVPATGSRCLDGRSAWENEHRRRGRMAAVKIVSLLPSATEIVFALGLGDSARRRELRVRLSGCSPGGADRVGFRPDHRGTPRLPLRSMRRSANWWPPVNRSTPSTPPGSDRLRPT